MEKTKKFALKLAQKLHEVMPASKRVYFVYTHRNGYDRFNNGLKANTEISYWIYKALRSHFPSVRFLRFQGEKPERIAKIRSQDVVIGHVGPTFVEASRFTKKLISFGPWVGDSDHSCDKFNCVPKEVEFDYYNRATSLILLTSEFNKREYFEKPSNFWYSYFQEASKTKRIRIVHQPVDLQVFKRIKWEYTTNDFLYIGNQGHMKGIEDAIELVHNAHQHLHLYGVSGRSLDHLNASQVNQLSKEADFFIQPGLWEAQCVSVLEAAARGFIPVVSKETGYPYDHPFLLRPRDNKYNAKVIKELLHTTPDERRVLADALHKQLTDDSEHNHWSRLTDIVVEEAALL